MAGFLTAHYSCKDILCGDAVWRVKRVMKTEVSTWGTAALAWTAYLYRSAHHQLKYRYYLHVSGRAARHACNPISKVKQMPSVRWLELWDLQTGAYQNLIQMPIKSYSAKTGRGRGSVYVAAVAVGREYVFTVWGIQTHQLDPSRPGGSLRSFLSDSLTENEAPAGSWQRSRPDVTWNPHRTNSSTLHNINK